MFDDVVQFIQDKYKTKGFIPLHEPRFIGNEKKYLNECIDSTFVSSVGKFVDELEKNIAQYTGVNYAIATSSGTSALHIALLLADVTKNDEVITQPLTFVATCNAIKYCNAEPVFVDVDKDSMGLSPIALLDFLQRHTIIKNQQCINNSNGKVIKACIPMHTFGHPCKIDKIKDICNQYHIRVIEDAAESFGSWYKNQHTGTFGELGVMSFNGNKIITAGGGGCIITNNETLAKKAKHLTTTAKIPHEWEYAHDSIGYNYRLPNINAALLVAQLENLDDFLLKKRELAIAYANFFDNSAYTFVKEPADSRSNYWLNTIILKDQQQRDLFLYETNKKKIMTRPVWILMHKLPMFKNAQKSELGNAEWLAQRMANIPSSIISS